MKKKLISITGFICSTTNCVHLALDTPQKIDFNSKRITMIEKYIAQKLSEKATLEQTLQRAQKTEQDTTTLSGLQAQILAISADITKLQDTITVAKNSVKSLQTP